MRLVARRRADGGCRICADCAYLLRGMGGTASYEVLRESPLARALEVAAGDLARIDLAEGKLDAGGGESALRLEELPLGPEDAEYVPASIFA